MSLSLRLRWARGMRPRRARGIWGQDEPGVSEAKTSQRCMRPRRARGIWGQDEPGVSEAKTSMRIWSTSFTCHFTATFTTVHTFFKECCLLNKCLGYHVFWAVKPRVWLLESCVLKHIWHMHCLIGMCAYVSNIALVQWVGLYVFGRFCSYRAVSQRVSTVRSCSIITPLGPTWSHQSPHRYFSLSDEFRCLRLHNGDPSSYTAGIKALFRSIISW